MWRFGTSGSRLAFETVGGVLDQSADRGQRACLFLGELGEEAGELGGCRGHGRDGATAGAYGDQVQVLLDAAGLVREAAQTVGGWSVPGAVEVDQVGDQVQAPGLRLDGDPPAAVLFARDLDTGGPREPVSDLRPLRAGQVPVLRMQADVHVEDRLPVAVRAGGERVLQVGVFKVLGPLGGRPRLRLVVQGEVVQAGPVGDDCMVRQALVWGDRPAQCFFEGAVGAVRGSCRRGITGRPARRPGGRAGPGRWSCTSRSRSLPRGR